MFKNITLIKRITHDDTPEERQTTTTETEFNSEITTDETSEFNKADSAVFRDEPIRDKGGALLQLYNQIIGIPLDKASYSDFSLDGDIMDVEQKTFIDTMQDTANQRLMNIENDVNASCFAAVSDDSLLAWVFIFPPSGNGEHITLDNVNAVIAEAGITHGLESDIIEHLVEDKKYLKLAVIARGTPSIPGTDGYLEYKYPRENCINVYPPATENLPTHKGLSDEVDEEELIKAGNGFIPPKFTKFKIHEGEVICELFPPGDPTDGISVTGEPIPGNPGNHAVLPNGENTIISSDGTRLIAGCNGQLYYDKHKFGVSTVTHIHGDVNRFLRDIDVFGDVIVDGNVLDGFTIQASGNVNVNGMVAGANIISGGNIHIRKGMNGNNRGFLRANGDVTAKFFENCTVENNGFLTTDSIISCQISCGGNIDLTNGLGIIIGGSISLKGSLKAKVIGSKANRETEIIMGLTSAIVQERRKIESDLATLIRDIDGLEKNVNLLSRQKNLTPEYEQLFKQLKLKLSVSKMQQAKLTKKRDVLWQSVQDLDCHLHCGIIYPTTRVAIGNDVYTISQVVNRAHLHRVKGEGIILSTY
ncbi:MAG: DUF342 domain-containing protein [Oscillospiraceae bacterium]|nr:DUF342 domain-containing protein [Oscillospiraceae bacterium]